MELNSHKIWVIYKTDIKENYTMQEKDSRKLSGKNLIEDFRQVSRSQSSTCQFNGDAAANFFPQKTTDNKGRGLVGQT